MRWLVTYAEVWLAIAAFLAAFAAIYAARSATISNRENRKGQIRERWVADFRDAMADWLALMDYIGEFTDDEARRFRRVENSLELSFDLSDQAINELRDAMQELRFQVTEGSKSDTFSARSRVTGIARRIIQSEWEKARQGK